MFKKLRIQDLEQQRINEKKIQKIDKERAKLNIKFDQAPIGSIEKGKYLQEFIQLTEERIQIKSSFGDKKGLQILKKMYKNGLKYGKWKEPNKEKE